MHIHLFFLFQTHHDRYGMAWLDEGIFLRSVCVCGEVRDTLTLAWD